MRHAGFRLVSPQLFDNPVRCDLSAAFLETNNRGSKYSKTVAPTTTIAAIHSPIVTQRLGRLAPHVPPPTQDFLDLQ